MKTISLTQGKVTTVDDEDYEQLNKHKWHYCDGYAMRRSPMIGGVQGDMILMHREILKTPKGLFTDHVDENRLNNQKHNLRTATKSQNGFNRGKNKNNTSRFKGVCFNSQNNNFRARIQAQGVRLELGSFPTATKAATAYADKSAELHGEFARTSSKQ